MMVFRGLPISVKQQSHIYAMGFVSLITLGSLALLGLIFAAFWLLIQFLSLLLASIVEACNAISLTFTTADPLVKFLILFVIGVAMYRVVRKVWR